MKELIKTVDQAYIENRPLSKSSLKKFSDSPKHYIKYLNGTFEKTEALILGDLVDCLLLTPEDQEKKFMVYEKFEKRSNATKEKWAAMIAEASKDRRTLVTNEQVELAKTCRTAVMDMDESRALIEGKKRIQQKLEWRNKDFNFPLIGYTDFESNAWGDNFLIDLKTTKCADPDKFVRDAVNFHYQIDAAAYLDAYKHKFYSFPTFIFLAVETSDPFNVSINICDDKYMEKANEEYLGLLQAFRYCMDHQLFHMGYEFRLMGIKDYFNMTIPAYYKPSYPGGFEKE